MAAVLALVTMSIVTAPWARAQSPAGNVALILSAEDYASYKASEIGAGRAQEIASLLKARAFDVSLVTNPANAAARAALRDFVAKANGARVAIVFILGHGLSASGQTFFLPTNASSSARPISCHARSRCPTSPRSLGGQRRQASAS